MRSHDQWNTVPYALNDRYRGIQNGRRVVLVNPADIEELGLTDRQARRPCQHMGRRNKSVAPRDSELFAYPAARGSAASYYPETNVLVPWTASPRSATRRRPKVSTCGLNRRQAGDMARTCHIKTKQCSRGGIHL